MIENISRRRSGFVFLLLIISVLGPYAYACLQSAGPMQVGERIDVRDVSAPEFVRRLVTHEGRARWERARADVEGQRRDVERQRRAYPIVENRNDLAVALVHLGRVKEAIPILEEAEANYPGEYFTAANLGTAYELNGENRKALEWIREGINRKSESHYGTEWLHVKILEAKLAMETDPDWLRKHSVLGADFRAGENARRPKTLATDHLGQQKSLAEIEDALVYQLHERLEFVKPPDPVVADLLFDLSNVLALTRTAEHAKAIHELSRSYGPGHEELVSSRTAGENRAAPPTPPRRYLFYAAWGAALLLGVGGFYALLRRRKLQQRSV
jgi:tetratricopeptide (TPR) repeat protein